MYYGDAYDRAESIPDKTMWENHWCFQLEYVNVDDPTDVKYTINGIPRPWSATSRLLPNAGAFGGKKGYVDAYASMLALAQAEHKIPEKLAGKRLFFHRFISMFALCGDTEPSAEMKVETIKELSFTPDTTAPKTYWLDKRFTVPYGKINQDLSVAIPESGESIDLHLYELSVRDLNEEHDIDPDGGEMNILTLDYSQKSECERLDIYSMNLMNSRPGPLGDPYLEYGFLAKEDPERPGVTVESENLGRADKDKLQESYELSLLTASKHITVGPHAGFSVKFD